VDLRYFYCTTLMDVILVRRCFIGVMSTTCILHIQWYIGLPHGRISGATDKGIDNRALQLGTPEAHQARPNCNVSQNTSSYRMSIL
jgi:hypothetical protein